MSSLMRFVVMIVIFGSLTACASLGMKPDSRVAYEQGLLLFKQSKYNDAIPQFAKATELEPDFGQAYLYLGRSYLNERRWFEALQPLRTAWRLSPGEVQKEVLPIFLDALLGAAGSLLTKGNFQAAIPLFKEGLALAPDSPHVKQPMVGALLAYGGELLSQGNASEAVAKFTEATQIAPQNLEGYLGLARSFFQTGDLFKAMGAAGNALRLSPSSSDALSLLQQLQSR